MTRKELKEQAKQNLRGNWKWAALSSIFAVALFIIGSWMTANDITNNNERIIGDIISIIASFTFIGMSITFLHFNDKLGKVDKKPFQASFAIYNKKYFVPGLKVYFSRLIFIALWCLLLFIPGIIKEYSYSMAEFIMTDMIDAGKSMTFTQAITESKKLMYGHKMDFFILRLSFIGWQFLACLPLGIGLIWFYPYRYATEAAFYRKLAGNKFRQ